MKTALLVLALLSLVTGTVAWVAWSADLLPGTGAHGENWEKWSAAVDLDWKVIEISFPASIIFAVVYLFVKPRSKAAIGCGLSIIGVALAGAGAISFIMTHLGIR
jgi:hypothetical protein